MRIGEPFVASPLSTRMWRVCKEANRPWPVFSADDVTDYLIMEAVAVKAAKEDEEARKNAEQQSDVNRWKAESQQRLAELQ